MLRRNFLQICGLGALGASVLGAKASARVIRSGKAVNPRGSARNVIMVNLSGGISHVDTFDLKQGSWTPADFEPGTFGNLLLPEGLFPNLVNHTDKFSLLRALSGFEQVHQRAQYQVETGQSFNPTFAKEHPHIGSVMAYELAGERTDADLLPTFLAINARVQGSGMLSSSYAAFPISSQDGVPGLVHPDGENMFRERYAALTALDGERFTESSKGAAITDYHNFYTGAERMMYQPELDGVFEITESETTRYGNTSVGQGCALAVKALARTKGARVVQVTHGGWDHPDDIYTPDVLYSSCAELDSALAAMFEDLAATPGTRGGTLLDETMVVVTGEFGRTPGNLSGNNGRDHYPYAYAALVAGGGIVPNQAFGATDSEGWSITDRFWSQNRYITIYDVVATMYSALGIDWSKEIEDTPSGRVYEYTPKVNGAAGYYTDIVEMFG